MSVGAVPLLLAVDGDSLLHRAHHAMAGGGDHDGDGRPVWALRGLVTFIAAACARLRPDALVVGFDCRAHSVRKAEYPGYKAHRADKPPELAAQLAAAPELLAAAGFSVAVSRGFEADDVLASAAALARRKTWRGVLLTSDRDAFALVDDTTSVLRLVNGGVDASPLVTPRVLVATFGVVPAQYRDFAAMRGDTSDNLPGVSGIGRTLAARLLGAFGSLDDAYAALDGGRREEVVAAVGAGAAQALDCGRAREAVARNRRLMTMRDDLPLPDPGGMGLPLDRGRVQVALRGRQINLGPSLWALLGQPAPSWLGLGGYDRAPSYLPSYLPSYPPGYLPSHRQDDGGAPVRFGRPARPTRRRTAWSVPTGQLPLF